MSTYLDGLSVGTQILLWGLGAFTPVLLISGAVTAAYKPFKAQWEKTLDRRWEKKHGDDLGLRTHTVRLGVPSEESDD